MGLDNKIHVAFMPVDTTSILQPVNQGETSTFKSYYLRNSFCKAITDLDSGSADRPVPGGKLLKGLTSLGIIKNMSIHGENATMNISRSLEEIRFQPHG